MTAAGGGRYGQFLYGSREEGEHSGPPPRRRGEHPDRPSEADLLGTGLALNAAHMEGYDWDLRIDANGSLMLSAGLDEYFKDIAFATARESWSAHGQRLTPDTIADLELDIEQVLGADSRTVSVDTVAAAVGGPDTLRVDVQVTVTGGETLTSAFPLPS